jgi:hypothetical protein
VSVESSAQAGDGLAVTARVAQPSGQPLEVKLGASGPGRFEGDFPIDGPGTYLVRVEASRDGAPVAATDAALPVSYAAEFRRVSADTSRLEQIARAGGGGVLSVDGPAQAFADNLAPVRSPLPLQSLLLLIAAILLPIDVALRRLRISPSEIADWVRRPRRLDVGFALPSWLTRTEGERLPAPAWLPGMRRIRRPPQRPVRPGMPTSVTSVGPATPALARQNEDEGQPADEDPLAETLRWLAARRRGRPEN